MNPHKSDINKTTTQRKNSVLLTQQIIQYIQVSPKIMQLHISQKLMKVQLLTYLKKFK